MRLLLISMLLVSACSTKKTKTPYDDDASIVIYELNPTLSEIDFNYYGCNTKFTVLNSSLKEEKLYNFLYLRCRERHKKGCKN